MTTTVLGMALTWPNRVLMAECDPMGRRVLPGYMADRLAKPAGPGILGLALTAQTGGHGLAALQEYTLPMVDDGHVELLHGLRDPRHSPQLDALWAPLAKMLPARDGDVLADLGRVGGPQTPTELLRHADAVVMVLRPTLVHVDAAGPRLDALEGLVSEQSRVGVCVIADGPYSASEVERALGTPVLAELPCSPTDAGVLSDGVPPRRTFHASLLMRSLDRFGRRLRAVAGGRDAAGGLEADTTETAATAAASEVTAVPALGGRS
ncbi:hypothetical protein ACQPZP_05550 [Spirillospora sp. CA-142024]|uniref:hypothetical protein n=1 Tax=Spirillospora sp. CA-142024 TaxID=3240036 RepID=UPI003D901DC5